jgi:hypothetical protein
MRAMPGRPSLSVAVFVVAVWSASAGVALAQTQAPTPSPTPGADVGRTEDQVVLSGTVTVPRGRSVGEVVVFHGRALVAGVVVGDVVVLDGPIVVAGQVSGSVVALNGPIRLAGTASVGGDVLGSDRVRLEPGALVRGEVRDDVAITLRGALGTLGALLGSIAIAFSALVLLLLLLAFAPRGLDRVVSAGAEAPFASAGWGVVAALVLPVLALAGAASILGLPFGLSLLLGLGLIALVGYAFAAFTIGRLIVREPHGRVGALFAGWGVAAAIGLVPLLNVAAWFLGSVFGVGAGIVALWRARTGAPSRGRHRAGSAPVPHRPAHAHVTHRTIEAMPATLSSTETGRDDEPPPESRPANAED